MDGEVANFNADTINNGQIGEVSQIKEEPKTGQQSIISFMQKSRVLRQKEDGKVEDPEVGKRKKEIESDIDEDSIDEEELDRLIREKDR